MKALNSGTCSRVQFCLSREDQDVPNELVTDHGAELMRHWIKTGYVKTHGGQRLDLEKTRAVEFILKNPAYCRATKETVQWIDEACFRWLPTSQPNVTESIH